MTEAVKLLATLGRPLTVTGKERPRASVAVAPASTYERYMGMLIVGLPPRVRVGGKFRAFDAARAAESSYSRAATTTTGAFGGGENNVL